MNKNLVLGALIGVVILESGYIVYRHVSKPQTTAVQNQKPINQDGTRGNIRPALLSKGGNLTTSPLNKFAYQIAPGTLSGFAKEALVGFSVESKTNTDGSTTVTLTPKDSDDQHQEYTIKPGQVLYFIEQTPMDDKTDSDTDMNYRDDYGIITDSNGIVQ